MEMLKKKMMELWKDEEGATMVEYGLMVALIAIAVMVTVGNVGTALDGLFGQVETELNGGTP